MNRKNSILPRLFVLILLLSLPALACTTLTGDAEESDPRVETGNSDQPGNADSEEQPASTEADSSGAQDAAGEHESPQDSDNARESIVSALSSGLEVEAMRLHIVTEDVGSGLVSDTTLAFIRPDRYQMISAGGEFIIIEDITYLKGPDGKWITMPGTDMAGTIEASLDAFAGASVIDERLNTLSEDNVNYEGKESINGVDTLVYSIDEGLVGTGISSQTMMWIGEDDGLLYRQELSNKVGDNESRIIMDFEYGAAVTIEPPE